MADKVFDEIRLALVNLEKTLAEARSVIVAIEGEIADRERELADRERDHAETVAKMKRVINA